MIDLTERDRQIMIGRDYYGKTYTDIANKLDISPKRVSQIYNQHKLRDCMEYLNLKGFVVVQKDK